MTRLLIAVTAIIGFVRAFSALPPVRAHGATMRERWGPEPVFPVPRWIARFRERPDLLHCCFGCWWPDPGGIRYVRDESETLLAMLPDLPPNGQRDESSARYRDGRKHPLPDSRRRGRRAPRKRRAPDDALHKKGDDGCCARQLMSA
jgi:hypothetical protein